MKWTEFYHDRQAKPELVTQRRGSLDSGASSIYTQLLTLQQEYEEVKTLVQTLIDNQITQMELLLLELRQIKLHLASITDEDITALDVEDEHAG